MLLVSQSLGILPTPISTLNPHIQLSLHTASLHTLYFLFQLYMLCIHPTKILKKCKKKKVYIHKIQNKKHEIYTLSLIQEISTTTTTLLISAREDFVCFCVFQLPTSLIFLLTFFFNKKKNIVYVLWKIYICNGLYTERMCVCMFVLVPEYIKYVEDLGV